MKALIYVTEPVAWTEETLASYERISLDGRRRKAEKLKNLPDRVRCIRAGILLAQAYAYEKNRQMIREPAEADSLIWLPITFRTGGGEAGQGMPHGSRRGQWKAFFSEGKTAAF